MTQTQKKQQTLLLWRLVEKRSDGEAYVRSDGLRVIWSDNVQADGRMWLHVSFSRPDRMPDWSDLREVQRRFVGAGCYAYMVFPPEDRYVNIHPFCLHLWRCLATPQGQVLPEFSGQLASGKRSI